MKTQRQLLSMLLVLVLLLSSTVLPASAVPLQGEPVADITTQTMNELTARLTINTYFAERTAFLSGNSDSIASAVSPITNDEALHKDALISNGISHIGSTVAFTEINCWDDAAEAVVVESVTYSADGMHQTYVITHKIVVYLDSSNTIIVGSDGYYDPIANFFSASYVPPNSESLDPMALIGSNLCILHIAFGEVGYTETYNNITKYGAWYGLQEAWCAIFVSWCAYQANVSTAVIAKSASPITIKNALSSQNRHYLSQAYGGTYTPVPGDLIFMRDTPSNPGHIGIVVSVSGNTIRIIDGNWGNQVCDRVLALNDPMIVGFGNPNYATQNHTSSTWRSNISKHYKECDNCSCVFAEAAHIFRQENAASPFVCRICGYTSGGIEEDF